MISFVSGIIQSVCASLLYESIGTEDKNENEIKVQFKYNFIPLFQFIWILELYYFAINYFIKFKFVKQIIKYIIKDIKLIRLLEYRNNIILEYYQEWQGVLISLSILIFISAILINIIIRSFFEYNIRLILFTQSIAYFGKILLLSWLTYKLYTWGSLWYVLIMILAIIYTSRNEIKKHLSKGL